jgi:hypothetical protein
MEQTKLESLLEANVNVFIGFFVSLVFWSLVVVPVWDLPVSFADNLVITGWFTVLAIARGYLVRRFFNKRLHKAIHRFVRRIYA